MGNDYGYERVFSRELEAVANEQDVFIAISTSGNSLNIINAVEVSKKMGIKTFVLTGEGGGELQSKADCLNVPSNETARIQESHITAGHAVLQYVEDRLLKEGWLHKE